MTTTHRFSKKTAVLAGVVSLALIVIGAFAAGCGTISPQQGTDLTGSNGTIVNTIIVSGTGDVTTKPDKATIQVAVTNNADTAAAALDANSKAMQKVLDRLKKEGIADKDIETAGVSVYPNTYYDQQTGQQKTTGYQAQNTVTVTFTDLTKIGTIYAAVIDAGATNVYGPSWMLSDNNPAVTTALTKAIANARMKADAIAADQGVQLGEAICINETNSSQPYPIYEKAAAGGATDSVAVPPISPQNMDVTASVTVTYRMVR